MKKLRIYVDTSVLGGCLEPEFELWSNRLVADFRAGRFLPVFSDLLELELREAPLSVRSLYSGLKPLAGEPASTTDAVTDLSAAYERHAVLSSRYRSDMLHIALATVSDVDVVVSWNFKHIVRFDKIRLFNAVNLEQGYKPLAIYSPREVVSHGDEPDQGS